MYQHSVIVVVRLFAVSDVGKETNWLMFVNYLQDVFALVSIV